MNPDEINEAIAENYPDFCCPIDLQPMQTPMTLSGCGHSFSQNNIQQWVANQPQPTCPLCRESINDKNKLENNTVLEKKIATLRREIEDTFAQQDAKKALEGGEKFLADLDYYGTKRLPGASQTKIAIGAAMCIPAMGAHGFNNFIFLACVDKEHPNYAHAASGLHDGMQNMLELTVTNNIEHLHIPLMLGGGFLAQYTDAHERHFYDQTTERGIPAEQYLAEEIIMSAIDKKQLLGSKVVLHFVDHPKGTPHFQKAWDKLKAYPGYRDIIKTDGVVIHTEDILHADFMVPTKNSAICSATGVTPNKVWGKFAQKLLASTGASADLLELMQANWQQIYSGNGNGNDLIIPTHKRNTVAQKTCPTYVNNWVCKNITIPDANRYVAILDTHGTTHLIPDFPCSSAFYTSSGDLKQNHYIEAIIHAATADPSTDKPIKKINLTTTIKNIVRLTIKNKSQHLAIPLIGGKVFSKRLAAGFAPSVMYTLANRGITPTQYVAELIIEAALEEARLNPGKIKTLHFVDHKNNKIHEDNFSKAWEFLNKNRVLPCAVNIFTGDILNVNAARLPNFSIATASDTKGTFTNSRSLSGYIAKHVGNPASIDEEIRHNWAATCYGNDANMHNQFFCGLDETGIQDLLLNMPDGSAAYSPSPYGYLQQAWGVYAVIHANVGSWCNTSIDKINWVDVERAVRNSIRISIDNGAQHLLFPLLISDSAFENWGSQAEKLAEFIMDIAIDENTKHPNNLKSLFFVDYTSKYAPVTQAAGHDINKTEYQKALQNIRIKHSKLKFTVEVMADTPLQACKKLNLDKLAIVTLADPSMSDENSKGVCHEILGAPGTSHATSSFLNRAWRTTREELKAMAAAMTNSASASSASAAATTKPTTSITTLMDNAIQAQAALNNAAKQNSASSTTASVLKFYR